MGLKRLKNGGVKHIYQAFTSVTRVRLPLGPPTSTFQAVLSRFSGLPLPAFADTSLPLQKQERE